MAEFPGIFAAQDKDGWFGRWEIEKTHFLYLMSRQDAYTVANAILLGRKMSLSH